MTDELQTSNWRRIVNHFYRQWTVVAVLTLSLVGWALPAAAESAAVDVNVTFTRALVVIAGDPVQFGNVLINGNAGTVNIDKDTGTVTSSGGVISIDQTTSQRGFVSFIAPRPGNVGITYPAQIALTSGVDNPSTVTFSPATEVNSLNVTRHNELVEIKIGGSLNFDLNTQEGLYNGAVLVEVDYV